MSMKGGYTLGNMWDDPAPRPEEAPGPVKPITISGLDEDPLPPQTLRRVREFFGDITQDDFARILGVSLRTVKAWERNRRDEESRNCTNAPRQLIRLLVRLKIAQSPSLDRYLSEVSA